MIVRSFLASVVLVCFSASAQGQAKPRRFHDIPYLIPADQVDERLRALGYEIAPGGQDTSSVQMYKGPNDLVMTSFSAGKQKLLGISTLRGVAQSEAAALVAVLRDSLVRVYGPPSGGLTWSDAEGKIVLRSSVTEERKLAVVFLHHASHEMGLVDGEEESRADPAPTAWFRERRPSSRWQPLSLEDSAGVAFDQTRVSRPHAGVIRVWLAWEYLFPRSFYQFSFNTHMQQVEVRCRTKSLRVHTGQFYLNGAIVAETGIPDAWATWEESVPGSRGETIIEGICRSLGPGVGNTKPRS